ncbi:uncharacterized protein [Spinacia oleracea]|uniref:Syntaxin N-terminal domain-containing protein n=1 Tax=Spinacia oleracea TaxID=3562 RepID=A0ABM3RSK5_SPIOL|nr:uncharacterized protein LOC110788686 [Spinacia oleracea]
MASYHTRSFSFPSNSHPVADELDAQLSRLRSSQAASTSSLSSKLNGLNDLYKCVEEFLQLPQNQNTVSQSQGENVIEQVLDGSLRLLDICSTSRDVLAVSKERIQDIQSVLRRRCSGELDITNEVAEYLKTRKTSKKIIKKCLKDINAVDKTNESVAIESMLKDVQALTVDTSSPCCPTSADHRKATGLSQNLFAKDPRRKQQHPSANLMLLMLLSTRKRT